MAFLPLIGMSLALIPQTDLPDKSSWHKESPASFWKKRLKGLYRDLGISQSKLELKTSFQMNLKQLFPKNKISKNSIRIMKLKNYF